MAIRVPRRNLLQIGTRAAGRPIRSEAEVLSMPRVDLIGAVSSGQPDVGGTINQFATNVMKLKQEADTKTRNQQITNIVTSTGEQISGMAHEAIVQFTDDYRRGKNDGDIDGDFSIQLQNKLKGRIKENTIHFPEAEGRLESEFYKAMYDWRIGSRKNINNVVKEQSDGNLINTANRLYEKPLVDNKSYNRADGRNHVYGAYIDKENEIISTFGAYADNYGQPNFLPPNRDETSLREINKIEMLQGIIFSEKIIVENQKTKEEWNGAIGSAARDFTGTHTNDEPDYAKALEELNKNKSYIVYNPFTEGLDKITISEAERKELTTIFNGRKKSYEYIQEMKKEEARRTITHHNSKLEKKLIQKIYGGTVTWEDINHAEFLDHDYLGPNYKYKVQVRKRKEELQELLDKKIKGDLAPSEVQHQNFLYFRDKLDTFDVNSINQKIEMPDGERISIQDAYRGGLINATHFNSLEEEFRAIEKEPGRLNNIEKFNVWFESYALTTILPSGEEHQLDTAHLARIKEKLRDKFVTGIYKHGKTAEQLLNRENKKDYIWSDYYNDIRSFSTAITEEMNAMDKKPLSEILERLKHVDALPPEKREGESWDDFFLRQEEYKKQGKEKIFKKLLKQNGFTMEDYEHYLKNLEANGGK